MIHTRCFALSLLPLALSLAVGYAALGSPLAEDESAKEARMLQQAWDSFKHCFIDPDGRVIRPKNDNDTVSEGQAYAMLRAVWTNDLEAFEKCHQWAELNLSRRRNFGDNLLAWHWGKRESGTWGVMDWNAASDADEDYALALFLAAEQWREPAERAAAWRKKAKEVIADIMRLETVETASGRRYLTPWPSREHKLPVVINPSYFAPAHYRIFARETGDERWLELVASGYCMIQAISQQLGDKKGAGLLPNWCQADLDNNFGPAEEHDTSSSWEAFRAYWRISLDHLWFDAPEARMYLAETLAPFLLQQLKENQGRIFVEYTYEGKAENSHESSAMYSVCYYPLKLVDEKASETVLEILKGRAIEEGGLVYFDEADDYYVNSWAWVGLAFKQGAFRNSGPSAEPAQQAASP